MNFRRNIAKRVIALAGVALIAVGILQQTHVLCVMSGCANARDASDDCAGSSECSGRVQWLLHFVRLRVNQVLQMAESQMTNDVPADQTAGVLNRQLPRKPLEI